jgi:hypothetical protein
MPFELLVITAVALLAYMIKGATGFGASITLVALGALVLGVTEVVLAATMLDICSGLLMLRITSAKDVRGFWLPLVGSVAVGSVVGAVLLTFASAESLGLTVGVLVTGLGLWFVAGRPGLGKEALKGEVPERANWKAHAVAAFSGFTGGFVGMSGPPLVFYLGSWMDKHSFRRVLVPLLLAAAVARFVPYAASGLLTREVLMIALAGLPPLLVGPWLGDKLFKRLDEKRFGLAVGLMLLAVGVKWLLS